MRPEGNPRQLEFHALGRREVVGRFDGGRITSVGAALPSRRPGLLEREPCPADSRAGSGYHCSNVSELLRYRRALDCLGAFDPGPAVAGPVPDPLGAPAG